MGAPRREGRHPGMFLADPAGDTGGFEFCATPPAATVSAIANATINGSLKMSQAPFLFAF